MPEKTFYIEATETIMDEAIQAIDTKFGKGHAEKNPALLGAFMVTASQIIQNKTNSAVRR